MVNMQKRASKHKYCDAIYGVYAAASGFDAFVILLKFFTFPVTEDGTVFSVFSGVGG